MKNHQSKRYNKKPDSNSTKFTCFSYGKQGHMKVDCQNLVNKENGTREEGQQIWKRLKSIYSLGRQCYIF